MTQSVATALDGVIKPLCDSLPAADEPGTATYSLPVGSAGLHLLGGVTITATIIVTGPYPELVGRLWDVAPGGTTRQIVELGAYRPSANQAAGTGPTAHGDREDLLRAAPERLRRRPGPHGGARAGRQQRAVLPCVERHVQHLGLPPAGHRPARLEAAGAGRLTSAGGP